MKGIAALVLVAALVSGCASYSTPIAAAAAADARTGTEHTPYRSMPTALQCGDCDAP